MERGKWKKNNEKKIIEWGTKRRNAQKNKPLNGHNFQVKLTCDGDSDEEEESVEMVKKVQVITNCTCTSCNKDLEEYFKDHQKHHGKL